MAKEEEKKAAPTKKAPAKSAASKKAPTAKKDAPAKAKATTKKAAPAKKEKKQLSGKTITVTQTGSPIGRNPKQKQTLIGLGLNKMQRTRTLEDTPAVRGMINKVHHLVKVEEAA